MIFDGGSSPVGPEKVAAARSQLEDEGWCVIPDILTDDETKDILNRLWAAEKRNEASGVANHLPNLDPNASNVRIFHLLERDPIFRELIQHPVALQMVEGLLGSKDFLISNFTANIARPGSQSMGLHSDQSLVVPDPWLTPWALNVIWCVTDTYFENGSTLFIPQSHKWTSRKDIPKNAKQLLKPFVAKAGSILVMDGRLWHTSGANITKDQDRALMFAYYTAPFLRQQVNWTARLSDDIKEDLGPEMREWLGLSATANVGKISPLVYLSEQYKD